MSARSTTAGILQSGQWVRADAIEGIRSTPGGQLSQEDTIVVKAK
jgi:hypothetical protein